MRSQEGPRLRGRRIVFVLAGEVLGGAERGAIALAHDLELEEGASVHVCALDDRPGQARRLAEEYGIAWSSIRTPWVGSRVARLPRSPGSRWGCAACARTC